MQCKGYPTQASFMLVFGGSVNIIHTKVFSSKEDFEHLKFLVLKGWSQGDSVMVFSVKEGLRKDRLAMAARLACHQLALDYGLPEIEGLYGISEDGEFVRSEG